MQCPRARKEIGDGGEPRMLGSNFPAAEGLVCGSCALPLYLEVSGGRMAGESRFFLEFI